MLKRINITFLFPEHNTHIKRGEVYFSSQFAVSVDRLMQWQPGERAGQEERKNVLGSTHTDHFFPPGLTSNRNPAESLYNPSKVPPVSS